MRILDRYIFREISSYAILGLVLFTFIFFVPQLVQLMDLVVRHGGGIATTTRLVATALPGILSFTIPMAILVGILIGLGRMSADSELIAMHATGLGLRRILLPVGGLALLATGMTATLTFWLAPRSARAFASLEEELRLSPAAIQIQPRVFDERFGRWLIYVEDVDPGGSRWRGILLATLGDPQSSQVTLAEEAALVADRPLRRIALHLKNGSIHEYSQREPDRYSISTFGENSLSLELGNGIPVRVRRPKIAELHTEHLHARARTGDLEARIEWHRRLAFPAACLVFALLAVPVGVRPVRGGRASGFVLTLGLIAAYYILLVAGIGLARRGTLPPALGVWGANLLTALFGLTLLPGMEEIGRESWLGKLLGQWSRRATVGETDSAAMPRPVPLPAGVVVANAQPKPFPRQRHARAQRVFGFPLLLDLYLARQFFFYFLILLSGSLLLLEAFTFFELVEDISRNQIPVGVVARYFFFLTPHLFYQLAPLAASTATLVALALMTKHNEITASKASGISFFRLSLPLLVCGVALAAGLFFLDSNVLPYTNQTQDLLRNQIKGRPAQTFFQPRRQWIFGREGRLYNYELFDPDRNLFGGLNVFEIDPASFQLRRRIYARRALWDPAIASWRLEEGWVRVLERNRVAEYQPFTSLTLAELREPPDYFRREVRQYYQMNWRELRQYIRELRQAGFDATRLTVQWHRKFAFPLMLPILMLLAAPFALKVGNRGATGGLAAGLGVAIVFWATAALFEAFGAVGQLPSWLAGWAPAAIFTFLGLHFYLKTPT
ncbi:MAG: LPS export ABC transporter permease LptF [Acidobacteriia bacterium]|jgi:LPS export ABC transporter permease LptF/LPS export ABC transporter permease LptG|nr:LPS export ABC transporter permease LptF [Terriglobia bacterium]